jgi:hypothetical protein
MSASTCFAHLPSAVCCPFMGFRDRYSNKLERLKLVRCNICTTLHALKLYLEMQYSAQPRTRNETKWNDMGGNGPNDSRHTLLCSAVICYTRRLGVRRILLDRERSWQRYNLDGASEDRIDLCETLQGGPEVDCASKRHVGLQRCGDWADAVFTDLFLVGQERDIEKEEVEKCIQGEESLQRSERLYSASKQASGDPNGMIDDLSNLSAVAGMLYWREIFCSAIHLMVAVCITISFHFDIDMLRVGASAVRGELRSALLCAGMRLVAGMFSQTRDLFYLVCGWTDNVSKVNWLTMPAVHSHAQQQSCVCIRGCSFTINKLHSSNIFQRPRLLGLRTQLDSLTLTGLSFHTTCLLHSITWPGGQQDRQIASSIASPQVPSTISVESWPMLPKLYTCTLTILLFGFIGRSCFLNCTTRSLPQVLLTKLHFSARPFSTI